MNKVAERQKKIKDILGIVESISTETLAERMNVTGATIRKDLRDMESHVRKDQKVTSNDKIITLSTCVGGQPNNRYLVQAVLTDERSTK